VAARALSRLLALVWPWRRRGEAGEWLACRHLQARGFEILSRNFRCRLGELDVVARDGKTTVFVEVKQRRDDRHGDGHEAVTRGKRLRIVRAAKLYAAVHGLTERPLRFDVISIDAAPPTRMRIRHDEGAFDSDGR
jgi:putative endonuclease